MKKVWNNPQIQVLGLKNTLCDDYAPSHEGGGNSGKLDCPYCDHKCPNQTTLDKHINDVHNPIPPTEILPPLQIS